MRSGHRNAHPARGTQRPAASAAQRNSTPAAAGPAAVVKGVAARGPWRLHKSCTAGAPAQLLAGCAARLGRAYAIQGCHLQARQQARSTTGNRRGQQQAAANLRASHKSLTAFHSPNVHGRASPPLRSSARLAPRHSPAPRCRWRTSCHCWLPRLLGWGAGSAAAGGGNRQGFGPCLCRQPRRAAHAAQVGWQGGCSRRWHGQQQLAKKKRWCTHSPALRGRIRN